MIWGDLPFISEQGGHIAGANSNPDTQLAVRWRWNGAAWAPEELGKGVAVAISADGKVVVGNSVHYLAGPAFVWTESAGGGSRRQFGTKDIAHDVSASGTTIVGFRWAPCTSGSCEYEVPIYWNLQDGKWVRHDLKALNGVDSEALGVGEVNGRVVIVGYGYTKRDSIMRAVAWLPDANGTYGSPIRLAAIGGKSKAWAWAKDVNAQGMVVGTSQAGGTTRHAVLWALPN